MAKIFITINLNKNDETTVFKAGNRITIKVIQELLKKVSQNQKLNNVWPQYTNLRAFFFLSWGTLPKLKK